MVRPSHDGDFPAAFDAVKAAHDLTDLETVYMLDVPHDLVDGSRVDTMDRVRLGAAFLADLVAAGL